MKKKGLVYFIKKTALRWQRHYTIGMFKLRIPPGHSLPLFSEYYPQYDRFLPLLAAELAPHEVIVDVGANIGDSLFAMLPHHEGPFVLVEGSPFFLEYLHNNLTLLDKETRDRIHLAPVLAGTGELSGSLSHTDGRTASRLPEAENPIPTQSIDQITHNKGSIGLIKADTDGFDWDVLLSAKGTIAQDEPLLFWENEVFEPFQKDGYHRLYAALKEWGYTYFAIFDNYGALMMELEGTEGLNSLCDYLLNMNKGKSVRTLFYVDILAYTEKRAPAARKALEVFRKKGL